MGFKQTVEILPEGKYCGKCPWMWRLDFGPEHGCILFVPEDGESYYEIDEDGSFFRLDACIRAEREDQKTGKFLPGPDGQRCNESGLDMRVYVVKTRELAIDGPWKVTAVCSDFVKADCFAKSLPAYNFDTRIDPFEIDEVSTGFRARHGYTALADWVNPLESE
jgi:hypothetical protein